MRQLTSLLRGLGAAGAAANARAELERHHSSHIRAEIAVRRVGRTVTAGSPLVPPAHPTVPWRDARRVA